MSSRFVSSSLAIIAVIMFLTACTGGPAAQVSASATRVTLASNSGDPAEVRDTGTAHVGDVVQTDSAGKAQLDFPDGSLTRLGPDTKLRVDKLDSASAQRTAVTLDVGESWHRVKKLVAEDAQYEVSTPVGVAAVKGTAFEVDCTDAPACTITVIEGVVTFTTEDGSTFEVNPYQRLVVPNPDGGDPVVSVAPADVVEADDWITGNIADDKITQDVPVEAASIAGEWKQAITYTSTSGVFTSGTGQTRENDWTFSEPECAAQCTFTITSSSGTTYLATLTADGFTAKTLTVNPPACTDPNTGETQPSAYDQSIEVTATRTDQASPPTSFSGTLAFQYLLNGNGFSVCNPGPDRIVETATLTIMRP